MADGKYGDGKVSHVNIQTNTDSIANPDTMFEKMINNKKESLEIVVEDSSPPVRRNNTHYVEMSLFDTFYEDYMNFENYIRDILDARYTNVAAKNELVSHEKESYSWTIKLATLEQRINALSKGNEHLKGKIESYIRELEHYVVPQLNAQKAGVSVIHIAGNNINFKGINDINVKKIAEDIINIGKKCAVLAVKCLYHQF